jgi:hypothetical protein
MNTNNNKEVLMNTNNNKEVLMNINKTQKEVPMSTNKT